MPNYQIKITPLEYYFFGGEKHNEELETNYFVESLPYPQQTGILGMLRYMLLVDKGLLQGRKIEGDKKTAADELIGAKSFQYGSKFSFEKIESLSPLYFYNGIEKYFFAPFDIDFAIDDNYVLSKDGEKYSCKKSSKFIQPKMISKSGKLENLSEIIKDVPQVGNKKAGKGATKENAFYKQNMKRLEKDWSFVLDASIDVEIKNKEIYLPFGGEKSFFKMQIERAEPFKPSFPDVYVRKKNVLFCISDCFVEGKTIKELPFAVSDYVSFRNLRSTNSTKNHYDLPKDKNIENGLVRSDRYQLLKRGSVLYFSDKGERDDFAKSLNETDGSAIGFNRCLTN